MFVSTRGCIRWGTLMQLIETALAFAITMLVLAMVCSAFVELVHRVFSMREAGLKYMLGQVCDQVLMQHLNSESLEQLVDKSKLPDAVKGDTARLAEYVRT